jgi:hypothetical protein
LAFLYSATLLAYSQLVDYGVQMQVTLIRV